VHRWAIKGDASAAAASVADAAAFASRAPRSICDPDLTPLALELELPKSRQSSPVNNDRRKLPGRGGRSLGELALCQRRMTPRRSPRSDRPVIYDGRRHADRSCVSRDYFDARKLRRREWDDEENALRPPSFGFLVSALWIGTMLRNIQIINSSGVN